MKLTKKENQAVAEKLRFLAGEFERRPQRNERGFVVLFTCVEIDKIFGYKRPLHSPVRQAYADVFQFVSNESDLWALPDMQDIRVMMLCFAAAMAETGDLV